MARKRTATDVESTEPKDAVETPLTPSQYFDILNKRASEVKEEDLKQLYENSCALMRKYKITGQKTGALKLYNFADLCARELKVVQAGYTVAINRSDLDEYITKVAKKTVVILKLEEYERDIPDDVVEKLAECKENNLFDDYYIVFTDYTGSERKKVEKEKREKDPILLGVLKIGNQTNNRLYHIASWEDEFCDLTLDRMVQEFNGQKPETHPGMAINLQDEFGSLEEFKKSFGRYNQ